MTEIRSLTCSRPLLEIIGNKLPETAWRAQRPAWLVAVRKLYFCCLTSSVKAQNLGILKRLVHLQQRGNVADYSSRTFLVYCRTNETFWLSSLMMNRHSLPIS